MMGAVYLNCPAPQNVAETGARNHPDGVADGRSRTRHPVLKGVLDLRTNVLNQRAPQRHRHQLHPAADSQNRQISLAGLDHERAFRIGPFRTHDFEFEPLSLAVPPRIDIRAAAGQEETV